MLIAWNYNKREPRFFSKGTYDLPDSNWSIAEATLASAANLLYFYPFTKKVDGEDNFYISGDNFAKSPAMYAFMVATEVNKKDAKNIRVVSIGSIEALPDKISKEESLIEWGARIRDMSAPVKKHTMDYMLDKIMDKNK